MASDSIESWNCALFEDVPEVDEALLMAMLEDTSQLVMDKDEPLGYVMESQESQLDLDVGMQLQRDSGLLTNTAELDSHDCSRFSCPIGENSSAGIDMDIDAHFACSDLNGDWCMCMSTDEMGLADYGGGIQCPFALCDELQDVDEYYSPSWQETQIGTVNEPLGPGPRNSLMA